MSEEKRKICQLSSFKDQDEALEDRNKANYYLNTMTEFPPFVRIKRGRRSQNGILVFKLIPRSMRSTQHYDVAVYSFERLDGVVVHSEKVG